METPYKVVHHLGVCGGMPTVRRDWVYWCMRFHITPNMLTLARFPLAPLVGWLLAKGLMEPALIAYAIYVCLDFLDGMLARALQKRPELGHAGVTSFGKYADMLADKFGDLYILWVLPTVPLPVFAITAVMESLLVVARPVRIWRLKRAGLSIEIIGSSNYGRTKRIIEVVMTVGFILEIMMPVHYVQLVAFVLALYFGTRSLYSQLAIPKYLQ